MIMKYPNGYLPKIQYWNGKLQEALASNEWSQAEYCMEKLQYFVGAQYVKENQQPYQPSSVIGGVDFSESLGMLKNL